MIKIQEAILVEGRYDKNTLSQIVDAVIFECAGFGIFHNPQQLSLLRKAAEMRGLIVLTDSDGAGLVIRNHIKSAIQPQYLKHAYIPDVYGKEKRKATAGKEGKLGVEGMPPEILLESLRRAGATFLDHSEMPSNGIITKQDFYDLGLSGRSNSAILRRKLAKHLDFPENISTNALLQALNVLYERESLERIVNELE